MLGALFGMLEGSDLLIVAIIVLVLFGGSQLPKLARSLGEAQRELKKALNDDEKPPKSEPPTTGSDHTNGTSSS